MPMLIVVVLLVLLGPHASLAETPPVVEIKFNVSKDNFASFHAELQKVLINYPSPRNVRGIPVLREQRCNREPPRWIHITLDGLSDVKTTLTVRDDNVYIVGFTNASGHWYVFENQKHLMPHATSLVEIKDDYGSLVKGHENLINYDLGRNDALQAVAALYSVRTPPAAEDQQDQLKACLAKVAVMIAEAQRFNEIFETVNAGWEKQTRLPLKEARRVVIWGKTSLALLKWYKTGRWIADGKVTDQGIKGQNDAMRVLRCILWSTSFKFKSTVSVPEMMGDTADLCE